MTQTTDLTTNATKTTPSTTAFRKNVADVVRSYREAHEDTQGRSLNVLFRQNGDWSGDVMTGGYSSSDRQRNGDYLFDELSEDVQEYILEYLEAACERLNSLQQPFGRGPLFYFEISVYDFI